MDRRLRTGTEYPSSDCPARLKSKARMINSVSALVDIASRLSKKLKAKPRSANNSKIVPKSSPMRKPKQLMSTISNKAITFLHRKKIGEESAGAHLEDEEEEWGNGGVWQRSILMGDKCEPLDFSGAIYYDSHGNQLNGAPLRSPRASPLPGYLERAAHKRN
ncbi:hypothetical protein GBA52_017799 [Prunus armeniaca]|nr:hypothetical protein GBA52_017799 [Prunus armeniaca]